MFVHLIGIGIAAALHALALSISTTARVAAEAPEFRVDGGAVSLAGVGPENPLLYDNDWWFDVFDNNYLWAQASLGDANLRGNIVSRDMWEWRSGYLYPMQKCVKDAEKPLRLARASGLRHIPVLTLGSERALERPASSKIEDTKGHPSAGSRLILAEARKATPERPLLIFAGGPLTTVANALLADPAIGDRIVVFSLTVSSNGYNGKDSWSLYIVAKRARLVNWATGSFWDKNSVFESKHFASLPSNPFCDDMRRLIASDLGQANQLGDGAPLVWLWRNDCWRDARPMRAEWRGDTVAFVAVAPGEAADLIDIPKSATDLRASRAEFFRVLDDPEVYVPH